MNGFAHLFEGSPFALGGAFKELGGDIAERCVPELRGESGEDGKLLASLLLVRARREREGRQLDFADADRDFAVVIP